VSKVDGASRRLGDVLDGRYRLESVLGSGGMATVYRGVDELLGRTVAVKLFNAGATDPADAERKASETQVLASLNHHALVTLFDARIGTGDDSYLVMEYVEGPTLAQRIAQSPISREDLAAMALDLADALHVVHEAQIVHRDFKPANVLLRAVSTPGATFRAKLADFGIAYLVDSARLTTPGTVIGTAAYLSPEQVTGGIPAPSADIYALGLVLIESLTGQRVFPQTGLHEALFARLDGPPEIPGSVGYEWKSLLTAMTAQNPDDRPTAADVAVTVRAMGAHSPDPRDTAAIAESTATALLSTSHLPVDQPTAIMPTAAAAPMGATEAFPAAPRPNADARTEIFAAPTAARTAAPAAAPRVATTTKRTPPAPKKRASRAWVWILIVVILVAVIGVALWAMFGAGSGAPLPELPDLPEPLGGHLDELLREVTP
jgi:serine/threonine protein kinase